MRKYLIWQSAACVALALGAAAMLGGYWYTQQQKVSYLQQQIDQLPNDKDRVSLAKDRIVLENAINGSLIQAVGGLLLFVTAFVSLQNLKATQRSVLVAEEKQVTERFTQAINQLGSDKIEIRLGGIYALERIARDSEKDSWTIMEVLTSFAQEKSPVEYLEEADQRFMNAVKSTGRRITKDIQATATVIGRRKVNTHEDENVDLSETSLCGASLIGMNFSGAHLSYVDFSEADLNGANLNEADLNGANLIGADLIGASLIRASLIRANLSKAYLYGADLSEANFSILVPVPTKRKNVRYEIKTVGANLSGAAFNGANLTKANLRGVNFDGADLSEANLSGAYLSEASLVGANFQNAKGLTLDDIKAAKNWEQAHYDEDFRQQLGLPPKSKNS